MAEGRWEDEVCRIGFGVWAKPPDAMAANPYRSQASRAVSKTESDRAFDALAAVYSQLNRDAGVTSA